MKPLESIRTTKQLLSEIIACGADVRKVRYAAEIVPHTGLDTATRPLPEPSEQWRYQVRIRIDGKSVPQTHAKQFRKAMALLHEHLKENFDSEGLEKTPLDDHRFSILFAKMHSVDDPFKALFPPHRDAHPELKTMHDGIRIVNWFHQLKNAAKGTLNHNGDGDQPVTIRLRVRTSPANQRQVDEVLDRLDEHLFEQNDGVPKYDHVECVERRVENNRHHLTFRFPDMAAAAPIFQAIQPDGGHH